MARALPTAPAAALLPGADRVELYAGEISASPGAALDLHVSTPDRYRLVAYRLGRYAGAGARRVACVPGCASDGQGSPQPLPPAGEEPIRAGWRATDVLRTGGEWTSGYSVVEAVLTSGPEAGRAGWTFFVLRAAAGAAPTAILVQAPVNTWEAHNQWGGKSLCDVGTRAHTDRGPTSLLRHQLVIVAGHDEYWTLAMDDPNPDPPRKTAMFREIGRPESCLMGVQHTFFAVLRHPLDYTVNPAGASDPWLAGTGLRAGDTVAGVVGREHDKLSPYPAACFRPGLTVIFHYDGPAAARTRPRHGRSRRPRPLAPEFHGGVRGASAVVAEDELGDADRLVAALALDRRGHRRLVAPVALLDRFDAECAAHARARRHGCGKAHPIKPVVDGHAAALLPRHDLVRHRGQERERQVAVRDRPAEGPGGGALGVDVDPLVVAGGVGEGLDPLLRDVDPRRGAELLTGL